MTQLLTDDFINAYPDAPQHMNELGSFVFYRTYSRFLPELGRRETWKEAVRRAVEYNVGISLEQYAKNNYVPPLDKIQIEAETLFDNIFNLRQFLSGRTHWVGGADTGVASKFPLANFNCSFINITKWSDLAEMFYLLLVGTGVGFKATKEMAHALPPIRNKFTLLHSEYKPVSDEHKLERTSFNIQENGFAKIYVGDSKEGWVEALNVFFKFLTESDFASVHTIKISYNSVRPKGAPLKTFGGTASGHEPLQEMFEGIKDVITGRYSDVLQLGDSAMVRPIHILDIGNLIGNNVVVGGVRRTAEIFLADADDWECILAKYGINGIWSEAHHKKVIDALAEVTEVPQWLLDLPLNDVDARPYHHRRMSNNSVAFESKPSREMLHLLFTIMQGEGEPGFVNLEAARKRRPNAEGLNPCAEILLDSYGVCNLTTVNVDAFVIATEVDGEVVGYRLDYSGLMQAQALSARAGIRMTCLDLELPHWDAVHKRDRLIGTSLTGWQDAIGKLGYDKDQELNLMAMLADVVHVEGMKYAHILRIPNPLLDTTVKPEGTLSQVAGGVSSGLHVSHAPYYIRRIRINAHDPLAKVAMELGWTVNPEVGQTWMDARTYVIDFPVKSGSTRTREEQTIDEQFDTYYSFQADYTAHNSSNTISVRPDEWERAEERVWDGWNDFVGVSFLAYDGGSYELAPYEEITEEKYNELIASMKPFDASRLLRWETSGMSELSDEDCSQGACAPR